MNVTSRDLRVWARRMRECRNPLLWASALNYDLKRLRALEFATGIPSDQLQVFMREIEDDADFVREIQTSLATWTSYRPRAIDFMMTGQTKGLSVELTPGSAGSVFFNEVSMYAIVRARKPAVMVETGGTPGKSTAFILRAMERNGCGALYTIDLPPNAAGEENATGRGQWHQQMPRGLTSNWVVPSALRARHTLLLGKSSEQLPPLLDRSKTIDIFQHDSDHSYENMTWEFQTAWPVIKPGGLLISDDVLDNTSFFDFCRSKEAACLNVFNLGVAPKTADRVP